MAQIFSYILRFDDGAAPNPFWGTCTLTICKPAIRRKAAIGDWVIGTGSKNSRLSDGKIHDLSQYLVYAMKVSAVPNLKEYDDYCNRCLPNKIPAWYDSDWRRQVGDCVYDYSGGRTPRMRKSVHDERSRYRDLGGCNALLSDHFLYFGEKATPLPKHLLPLIKRNQGHLRVALPDLVRAFDRWIKRFPANRLHGDPQMSYLFDKTQTSSASLTHECETDSDEAEEPLC